MKTSTALWCTALAIAIHWNANSQQIAPHEDLLEHIQNHIKPGMSRQQIDSLYQIASKHLQDDAQDLKQLIQAAQKKNKETAILKSQECVAQNWGFESGNSSNWVTNGCVSIENGGVDVYSGLPKVYNGGFSLKLSNDYDYNCLNSTAARTYSVPATGQTFITLHFAVNIFNFPHTSTYAAKFGFNLYDQNMNQLGCPTYQAYYTVDEGPVGIPGIQQTPYPATFYNPLVGGDLTFNSNVSYSNWHHVTVDLSAYAGTDVTLVFQNNWCYFDVDWIYTYIDVDCPVNNGAPVLLCADGPIELCAPSSIDASFTWEYNQASLNNQQPCITANQEGTYTLNFQPNYLECSNSLYELNYEIAMKPTANFTVDAFCRGQSPVIHNLSQLGTGYEWQYNEGVFHDFVPSLNYQNGANEVMLITSRAWCSDTLVQSLIVHENPLPAFAVENSCVGDLYKIVNHSTDPENSLLVPDWFIAPNFQSNDWHPSYIAPNQEAFSISLTVTNQFGCQSGISKMAIPLPFPKANFEQSASLLSENNALAYFNDASSNDVTSWNWLINGANVHHGPSFYHEFTEPGLYGIALIVKNHFGCVDTTYNELLVKPSTTLYVPNTFTPNGDEHNQLFTPVISGSSIQQKSYLFTVFDRWGDIVFQSNQLGDGWDGKFQSLDCVQGTYTWVINYLEVNSNQQQEVVGHVNLLH